MDTIDGAVYVVQTPQYYMMDAITYIIIIIIVKFTFAIHKESKIHVAQNKYCNINCISVLLWQFKYYIIVTILILILIQYYYNLIMYVLV